MLEPIPLLIAEHALRKAILYHWPQYYDIRVTHESLPLGQISTVIPMASFRRSQAADNLLRNYLVGDLQPYLPVRLGEAGALLSPLVEANGTELTLLDGMHRCLAALRRGLRAVDVVVLFPAVVLPPVGQRFSLSQVVYSGPEETPPIFFEGRGLPNYRPGRLFVETAARWIDDASSGGPEPIHPNNIRN